MLIATAKGEEVDEVVGFQMGADDYVVKPYKVTVLMQRIKAEGENGVADLLLANKTNRDISLIAEIEPRALAHLKRRIFQKLEVQSVSELGIKLGRSGGGY